MGTAKVFAILAASGSSNRFGADKLEIDCGGIPVWLRSYQALSQSGSVDAVGIVTRPDKVAPYLAAAPGAAFVVSGGETRAQSVRRALEAVPSGFEFVLVHDAARPFLDSSLVERLVDAVKAHGAAYPSIAVTDTVRRGRELVDRSELRAAQTPQGARLDWLRAAMQDPTERTDEMSYIQAAGYEFQSVEGDPANKKITHLGDIPLGDETRTGFGYDIHRFSSDPSRPMWLGGVEFDDRPGLEGHSDADALLHAVVDALLGAAGLGDIGVHYPPSDPQWKDCPSLRFLRETGHLLSQAGWRITNIDATVVAERPRVMPRAMEIRQAIADALDIEVGRVSVKATTNEGLGAIGKSEGIAGYATATIRR